MWRNWRALAHTTPCNQWNHPFVHHFCVCACGNWSAFPYFDSERRDLDSHGPARSHRLRGDRPGEQGRGQELRSFYTKRVCVVCHLQRSPAPCRSWTTITPETSNSYAPSSTPWRRNSLEDASGASYDAGNAIISGTSAWIVLFVPGGWATTTTGLQLLARNDPCCFSQKDQIIQGQEKCHAQGQEPKIRTRIFCSTRIGSTLEWQDFSVMTLSVQTGNATLAAKSPAEQKLNRLVAALEKQESGSSADCGPNHSKACLVQNHARCCCEARPSEEEATASSDSQTKPSEQTKQVPRGVDQTVEILCRRLRQAGQRARKPSRPSEGETPRSQKPPWRDKGEALKTRRSLPPRHGDHLGHRRRNGKRWNCPKRCRLGFIQWSKVPSLFEWDRRQVTQPFAAAGKWVLKQALAGRRLRRCASKILFAFKSGITVFLDKRPSLQVAKQA